jgi:hypothetical protein
MGSGISAEALSEEEIKALESKQEEDKLKGDITNIPPCIVCVVFRSFARGSHNPTVNLPL